MRRLAVLLAACGLLVWLAAPALSSRPYVPRVAEFEQSLGTGDWTRSGDRSWRSPVVRAPRRFDLVGLRWRDERELTARIRARKAGGGWGRWTLMADDHAGGGGAEPVWAGSADAYQLRIDGRPRGLRARFVNATGTATAADRATTALRRAAHGALAAIAGSPAVAQGGDRGAPAIIPREAWGADQCKPRSQPSYGEVRAGFVHHTVNANSYTPQQSAAIVLSICRYHRNSNGWRDIGYNFLVDRYGQIFEGRAGGVDQPVIGAQAEGYNAASTGVANIGTHSQAPQTTAGIAAASELLAWKLSLHAVPVTGGVDVRSRGGPTNRFKSGTNVRLQRISGHRDGDRTSCPGDALFAQLPEIRRRAAALAPRFPFGAARRLVSIQATDRILDYPQVAVVTGRATGPGGAPLAGVPIAVQIAAGSRQLTRAQATTRADGSWEATLATAYSRTVRAVVQLPDGSQSVSERLTVEVAPQLRLREPPERVTRGRSFTVRGNVRPRRGHVLIEVARKGSDKRWHTVARVKAKRRKGSFSARVRVRRAERARLQARFVGDERNRGARSEPEYVRATRR